MAAPPARVHADWKVLLGDALLILPHSEHPSPPLPPPPCSPVTAHSSEHAAPGTPPPGAPLDDTGVPVMPLCVPLGDVLCGARQVFVSCIDASLRSCTAAVEAVERVRAALPQSCRTAHVVLHLEGGEKLARGHNASAGRSHGADVDVLPPPLLALIRQHAHIALVPPTTAAGLRTVWQAMCGSAFGFTLPTCLLLSVSGEEDATPADSTPVPPRLTCTDVLGGIKRGDFAPSAVASAWPRNVFAARAWAAMDGAPHHVLLAPPQLLSAALYAGDLVLLRRAGRMTPAPARHARLMSTIAYVNAPDVGDTDSGAAAVHAVTPVPHGALYIPPLMMADVGIAEGDSVMLQRVNEEDVPSADVVTLMTCDSGVQLSPAALAAAVSAHFGIPVDAASPQSTASVVDATPAGSGIASAASLLATLSVADQALLASMARSASCKHVPLVPGQTIAVATPDAAQPVQLMVTSTRPPHCPVTVGVATHVRLMHV